MKIQLAIIVCILLFLPEVSSAETITFKNGQKIRAEITEKGSYYIVVNQKGKPRRYYLDQIESIEEDIVDPKVTENIDMDKFEFTAEEKVEHILKLIDVNGTRDALKSQIDQIIAEAPEGRADEMKRIFDLDGLLEELVPIFALHYTQEEVQQLIEFYESNIGQRVLEETPDLMQEVMEATAKYYAERSKQFK